MIYASIIIVILAVLLSIDSHLSLKRFKAAIANALVAQNSALGSQNRALEDLASCHREFATQFGLLTAATCDAITASHRDLLAAIGTAHGTSAEQLAAATANIASATSALDSVVAKLLSVAGTIQNTVNSSNLGSISDDLRKLAAFHLPR